MDLPTHFLKTLRDIHEDADDWLKVLPDILETLAERWEFRIFNESHYLPRLSYNLVLFAEGLDGTPYVLKLSPPSDEFRRERVAVQLYNGRGMARLLAADDTVSAMLLERLQPGVSLWNHKDDDEATEIIAGLLQKLWRSVPDANPLRTLESWTRVLPAYQGEEIPKAYVLRAQALLQDMLHDGDSVLLHGDLHHDNVLSAGRENYLAIDPKGIVGNKTYDLTPALLNPDAPTLAKRSDLAQLLERRVGIFSEMLNIDKREIAAWGFIQVVLGSIWSIEDHGEPWTGESFVRAFEKLM
ncbi:MAG: aminoglycoside phosphotransferase family protein [Trueperaceae bacterium]